MSKVFQDFQGVATAKLKEAHPLMWNFGRWLGDILAFLKQPVGFMANSSKKVQQTTCCINNVLHVLDIYFGNIWSILKIFGISFESRKTTDTTFWNFFFAEEAKRYMKLCWFVWCCLVEKMLYHRANVVFDGIVEKQILHTGYHRMTHRMHRLSKNA